MGRLKAPGRFQGFLMGFGLGWALIVSGAHAADRAAARSGGIRSFEVPAFVAAAGFAAEATARSFGLAGSYLSCRGARQPAGEARCDWRLPEPGAPGLGAAATLGDRLPASL